MPENAEISAIFLIKIYKYELKGTHDLIISQWVTVMFLLSSLFSYCLKIGNRTT